jgi:chromosomal replication initiator protein
MEAWDKSLAWIREKLNDQVFETWFSPVRLHRMDDSSLTLSVPNSFFKEWLSNNYSQLIREAMLVETGRQLEIVFEVSKGDSDAVPAPAIPTPEAPSRQVGSRLNPKYTFKNFVVGSSNQLPHAASVAIAGSDGQNFNPLFIYGGVGLGKTHLLHAIGNAMRARDPFVNVMYMSAEELMNEFVSSLRNNKMDSFRRKYRKSCDVLLIDDIQFIAGKDAMQDEFFHTLYEKNKHIVLTSDKYPQEISDLEERLRSRFQWGLIADIQAPELETRLAILKKKADDEGIPLPNDVALFLAGSVKSNIRELEGSLINLAAHASLENRRIDIAFAQETLKKMITLYQNRLTVENVQHAVCNHFNISMSDIKGARRQRSVSFPRQIAMYLCRKGLNASYPEIGDRFGGKDHTTAMAACRKIEKMVSLDVAIRNKVEALERLLRF